MRQIEKDRAFFIPELELLLEKGITSMEVADMVSRDLARSAKVVSSSVDRLPSAVRLSQTKVSAEYLAAVAPRTQYLDCRNLMKTNIPRIIEATIENDKQEANNIGVLQSEVKSMLGEVTTVRLFLREDVSVMSTERFSERLADINLADETFLALIGEYVSLEKGAFEADVDWEKLWAHQYSDKLSDLDASSLIDWISAKGNNSQLSWLKELGYSDIELYNFGKTLTSPEEREFWANIINKDYTNIYLIDPDILSDEVMHLMYSYSYRLVLNDKIAELETFINEMIKTDQTKSYFNGGGYGFEYLSRLTKIAEDLYTLDLLVLGSSIDELTYEEIVALYDDMEMHKDMLLLWTSVHNMRDHLLDDDKLLGSLEALYGYQINGLTRNSYGFEYNIGFQTVNFMDASLPMDDKNISDIIFRDEELKVRTYFATTMDEIRHIEARTNWDKLNADRDALFTKYLYDGLAATVGMYHPVAGMAMNFLNGAINQATVKTGVQGSKLLNKLVKPESGSGIEDLFGTNFQTGAVILAYTAEFFEKRESLAKQMDNEKYKRQMDWFGVVAGYETGNTGELSYTTVFEGLYNVDRLVALNDWEKNGLKSLLNMPEQEAVKVVEEITKQMEESETLSSEAQMILEGGDIYHIDIFEFSSAIRHIEHAYGNLYDDKLEIKTLFDAKKVKSQN